MTMRPVFPPPAAAPADPAFAAPADLPVPPAGAASRRDHPIRPPIRAESRVMTDEQLLEQRVEYRPTGPSCADCRHLGDPIRVIDAYHACCWRRRCPHRRHHFTATDWPACPCFERKEAA
jgi:hypothetical protein